MKTNFLTAVPLIIASSGAVNAEGVSMAEYQQVQSINQCAYIANIMMADNTVQVMKLALSRYVSMASKMSPDGYNPTPSDLAIDYAIFFQQKVSDTEYEMFQQINKRGLPLAPGSWVLVARDWWVVKQCSLVTGL
ncbi:hypothetical protein [Pectobacterium wasabiae]|nr:hypothetical protein [Pectobacterium wasabiae]EJS96273.1 Hypothetical protein Y17_0149 [Pectobacterium wasabiae CFBP 3304]